MKFNILAFVLTTICTISSAQAACKSVMGGCAKEPTHDTSSHMKSQIVNKVIHKPVVTAPTKQADNSVNGKQRTVSPSKSLVQAVSKATVR